MIGADDHMTIDVSEKDKGSETNANETELASAVKSRSLITTRFCVYGVQLINTDITVKNL